jgi:AcrR family transcriptional regulator
MGAKPAAQARNREATRTAILEATAALIAEKGFAGFTMSEVAQRGKINRALIYHYFNDRDNLLFETVRYIARRYEAVAEGSGADPLERGIRMHIEHPEIARFFYGLLLNNREIPKLSTRLTETMEALARLKAQHAPDSPLDPGIGVLSGWLLQLAWSFSRVEMARQLGLSVEEADQRFIRHLRHIAEINRKAYSGGLG